MGLLSDIRKDDAKLLCKYIGCSNVALNDHACNMHIELYNNLRMDHVIPDCGTLLSFADNECTMSIPKEQLEIIDRKTEEVQQPRDQKACQLKAIETRYNGYRFRSRLEAKWAVFLHDCLIAYQYEPEGFQCPSGWYLPDFWIPVIGTNDASFLEIKPAHKPFEEKTFHCLAELSNSFQQTAFLVVGDPVEFDLHFHFPSNHYGWLCSPHNESIKHNNRSNSVSLAEMLARKTITQQDEITKILENARYARSVRFEHGESPL